MSPAFSAPPFAEQEMDLGDSNSTQESPTEASVKAPTEASVKTPKKEVKRNSILIDDEKIKTVVANVKTKTYLEMAEMTGLSKHQVNRILQTLKSGMRQKALDADKNAYEMKENKKGEAKPDYSKPLSEIAKKVEAKIASALCRPEGLKTAGGGQGGKTKKALDSALDDLLADL